MPTIMREDEVHEAGLILINHSHFDHCKPDTHKKIRMLRIKPLNTWIHIPVPGADTIAKNTGATVIANAEAIRGKHIHPPPCVPLSADFDELYSVLRQRGVPESQLRAVAGGERIELENGIVIRPYPGLHCLMPFEREYRSDISFPDTCIPH
jgi:hypothetical protein